MPNIKELIPQDIFKISNLLKTQNFSAYLVGGSVRDMFLGYNINDFDITTNALPEDLKELFPNAILFGEKFGTIMIKEGNFNVEITTLRKDSEYLDSRHPKEVTFINDINIDLKRRDFTMNAIAYDFNKDQIIDIFDGIKDIKNKVIRSVGNPDDRFKEDALRLIRAVRFSFKLNFDIEEDTFISILKNAKLINNISKERIRDEFLKIIKNENSSVGVDMLRKAGLLEYIIPELIVCVGVKQNKYHSLDVYNHLLLSMDKADERIKLAALLHDIGKPQTKQGGHFFGHEKVGADISKEILERLKFPKKEIEIITKLIYLHLFHYESTWSDAAVRRFLRKVGDMKILNLLFLLRVADEKGNPISTYDFNNLENFKKRIDTINKKEGILSLKDLAINGEDLLGIGFIRDKKLGETLNSLLDVIIESPELNKKEYLLKIAKNKLENK